MQFIRNKWLKPVLIFILIIAVLSTAFLGYLAYIVLTMDDLAVEDQPQTSRFYYQNQELMTTQFVENRTVISLDEMSEEVIWATLAVEDRRFFEHNGFDLRGIVRAAYKNLKEGRITQGGSTITQQLAKNLYLTHDRTWERKIDEIAYTFQLERQFTKDQILEEYLNTIYYGHSTYGIEGAAQLYFEKPASELVLAEAALLAGLPRGPGYYSPFIDKEAALRRQETVLILMEEVGFICEQEREQALNEDLDFSESPALPRENNYIVAQVMGRELEEISVSDSDRIQAGGLELYTTIDPHMQSTAERLLREKLPEQRKDEHGISQPQGALVALEPDTGKIRALVGGKNYQESMLNRVNIPRSSGSAFKPLVYAAALEAGFTALDNFHCGPVSIQEDGMNTAYEPTDFGGGYHHEDLSLRKALMDSCNITAVKLNRKMGGEKTIAMAEKLGIESKIDNYLSMPLGTSETTLLELTAAYAAFANGGYRVEPVLLEEALGPEGEKLVKNSAPLEPQEKVLDEGVAYLITDLMKDVLQPGGTASLASDVLERPAAGKTGTSQGFRNAYMIGYTPSLAVGLYIGDDQGKSLHGTGGSLAAPLWAEFMETVSRDMDIPPSDFERPSTIREETICSETSLLQDPNCTADGFSEIFIKGTVPSEECSDLECPHIEEPSWWQWDFWFD